MYFGLLEGLNLPCLRASARGRLARTAQPPLSAGFIPWPTCPKGSTSSVCGLQPVADDRPPSPRRNESAAANLRSPACSLRPRPLFAGGITPGPGGGRGMQYETKGRPLAALLTYYVNVSQYFDCRDFAEASHSGIILLMKSCFSVRRVAISRPMNACAFALVLMSGSGMASA